MVKNDVKKEEIKVPVGGYYEVWTAKEANQLTMSGQYYVEQVCKNGKYVLVRKE